MIITEKKNIGDKSPQFSRGAASADFMPLGGGGPVASTR